MPRFYKILLAAIAILLLLSNLYFNREKPNIQEDKLIREMVKAYAADQDAQEIKKKLVKLSTVNPETAEQWAKIMDYWDYVNTDMTLNYGTLPDEIEDSSHLCMIVLGFQLNPEGTMRPELTGRLRTALACAEKYPDAYILCTGGGTASANGAVTEAGKMAEWLIENGIDPKKVIIEDKSLTTTENAIFSSRILREQYPDITTAAVITSDYHIPWGIVLFQTAFILDGGSVSVIDNAAFETQDPPNLPILNYQANGILSIAGLK